MNEKEAREIIKEHKEGKCFECFEGECQDEAKGYLEAIEKAKGLEIALRMSKKFSIENGFKPYWIDEAFAKWEKKK